MPQLVRQTILQPHAPDQPLQLFLLQIPEADGETRLRAWQDRPGIARLDGIRRKVGQPLDERRDRGVVEQPPGLGDLEHRHAFGRAAPPDAVLADPSAIRIGDLEPGQFRRPLERREAERQAPHQRLVGADADPTEEAIHRIQAAQVGAGAFRIAGDRVDMAQQPFQAAAGQGIQPGLGPQGRLGRGEGEAIPAVDVTIGQGRLPGRLAAFPHVQRGERLGLDGQHAGMAAE